jgi:hypothetical protein
MRPETKIVWNVGLLLVGFAALYWLTRTIAPKKNQEVE